MPPKRKQWDPDQMKAAINAVKNKEMGSYKASRVFCVPQTTLERYVSNSDKESNELITTKLGRKSTMAVDIEMDLADYCLQMEQRFFGLSQKDVRRLAFQLALKNGIKTPFSKEKESAGRKWLKNFLRRNPQLSIRTPQGLSLSRAKSFTPEAVARFFDLFEPAMEIIKHSPNRLYNCDETGVTVVQHKHTKIIGLKGKRQICGLQSAERGCLTTVVTCTNAIGHYVPPLIIFPRKNMKPELMDGMPPGSIFACHPSGWIQTETFTLWFRHFMKHVKPTMDDPVVLVLDGHFSHTRNLEVINLGRQNHVNILCIPPHATNKMQPLDLSFMSPLKTYYAQEIEQWLRNHPGRVVTVYQIGELFGKAYLKAATAEVAASGFKKAGLYPCDRNKFRDHDFPFSEETSCTQAEKSPTNGNSTYLPSNTLDVNQPGPSGTARNFPLQKGRVRALHVNPLPDLGAKTRTSRSGSAELITGSPYKNLLESSLKKKEAAETKKEERFKKKLFASKSENKKTTQSRKIRKRTSRTSHANAPKNKIPKASSSDSDSDFDVQIDDSGSDLDLSEDNDDAECIYCAGLFSEDHNGEDWIRCSKCFKWSHSLCADSENEVFICFKCKL